MTIYNYLALSKDLASASGRAYVQAMYKSNLSRVEEQLEEAASKRTKMLTTTFFQGRKSSPANLAAARDRPLHQRLVAAVPDADRGRVGGARTGASTPGDDRVQRLRRRILFAVLYL